LVEALFRQISPEAIKLEPGVIYSWEITETHEAIFSFYKYQYATKTVILFSVSEPDSKMMRSKGGATIKLNKMGN